MAVGECKRAIMGFGRLSLFSDCLGSEGLEIHAPHNWAFDNSVLGILVVRLIFSSFCFLVQSIVYSNIGKARFKYMN